MNVVEATLSYVEVLREILQLNVLVDPYHLILWAMSAFQQAWKCNYELKPIGNLDGQFLEKSKRNSTTIRLLQAREANIYRDDLVENEWKVVLQSSCHSACIMDVLKCGIFGIAPLNVELKVVPNAWGFCFTNFDGNTIWNWCGMKLMARHASMHIGAWIENALESGSQETRTRHMTMTVMQSMRID